MIRVRDDLKTLFPEKTVDEFMHIDSVTVKHVVADRRTSSFQRDGRSFYLKAHMGVGWREIFKNLSQLKKPVLGARDEWLAIQACHRLGIETMQIAAFGERGWNPATRHSFLITDSLENTVSLDNFFPRLYAKQPVSTARRLHYAITDKVAQIARMMHSNGLNHRDFYLCHLRIGLSDEASVDILDGMPIYLMDLHRMQIRKQTPERWLVKDIAALLYSAVAACEGCRLGSGIILRFIETYTGMSCKQAISRHSDFWRKVLRRAIRMIEKDGIDINNLPVILQRFHHNA